MSLHAELQEPLPTGKRLADGRKLSRSCWLLAVVSTTAALGCSSDGGAEPNDPLNAAGALSGDGGSGGSFSGNSGGALTKAGAPNGGSAANGGKASGGASAGGASGASFAGSGSSGGRGNAGGGGASSGGSGMAGSGGTPQSCSTGGKCPASLACPAGIGCGCYVVPGLGANKKKILDAGAGLPYTSYLLASAMVETEKLDTNYALGDNKSGDSFNAGVAKQNWGMIRTCHSAWKNLKSTDTGTAAMLNNDRVLDAQVYGECRAYYGDKWWAGHRNGVSGIANPNTQDIKNFKTGEDWTNTQIQNGHTCDDLRFWVNLPAIRVLPPQGEGGAANE
jgi:hypothetical protein